MLSYWQQVVAIGHKFPREVLRPFLAASNFRGALAVATTYGIIALSNYHLEHHLFMQVPFHQLPGRGYFAKVLCRRLLASDEISGW